MKSVVFVIIVIFLGGAGCALVPEIPAPSIKDEYVDSLKSNEIYVVSTTIHPSLYYWTLKYMVVTNKIIEDEVVYKGLWEPDLVIASKVVEFLNSKGYQARMLNEVISEKSVEELRERLAKKSEETKQVRPGVNNMWKLAINYGIQPSYFSSQMERDISDLLTKNGVRYLMEIALPGVTVSTLTTDNLNMHYIVRIVDVKTGDIVFLATVEPKPLRVHENTSYKLQNIRDIEKNNLSELKSLFNKSVGKSIDDGEGPRISLKEMIN